MKIIGKTPSQLFEEGSERQHVKDKFTQILRSYIDPFDKKDKFFFYAYNSPFDSGFLRSFFTQMGDKFYGSFFWTPDICIMRLVGEKLLEKRAMFENFKLGTVCREVGIPFDETEAHDAMYDIKKTYELYKKEV